MPGHLLYPGRGLCGELLLVDSDIPVTVLNACMKHTWENGPDLWLDSYPCPQAESYKYTRGEVLILGGESITGASCMTALAASRAGAGMVTVAAPAKAWSIYASSLMNAVVLDFDGSADFAPLLADARRNVVAIGPGAGVGAATRDANAPPQLATGGSGDVLTGFVAAPLAQGMAPFEAAPAAVWLHGAAAAEFGLGLVAADLPDALPAVLQRLKASSTH